MRLLQAMLAASIFMAADARVSHAAQFRALDLPDGGGQVILLSGSIEKGDEAAFHTLAETLPKAVVITTGPGGFINPAMAIGTEIRARGWTTLVPAGIRCASACTWIWLAGSARMLGADAQIGFHAISVFPNGQRTETHDFDSVLRGWLTSLGYTLDTTATMMNTPAASVRWFNIIELRANGIPTEAFP